MMVYALPLLVAGLAGIANETIDRILIKQTSHPTEIYQDYLSNKIISIHTPEDMERYIEISSEIMHKDFNDSNRGLSIETQDFIKEVKLSELGLYGAFYKLSILMILFIQTFKHNLLSWLT